VRKWPVRQAAYCSGSSLPLHTHGVARRTLPSAAIYTTSPPPRHDNQDASLRFIQGRISTGPPDLLDGTSNQPLSGHRLYTKKSYPARHTIGSKGLTERPAISTRPLRTLAACADRAPHPSFRSLLRPPLNGAPRRAATFHHSSWPERCTISTVAAELAAGGHAPAWVCVPAARRLSTISLSIYRGRPAYSAQSLLRISSPYMPVPTSQSPP
jgi:hypothetical protein